MLPAASRRFERAADLPGAAQAPTFADHGTHIGAVELTEPPAGDGQPVDKPVGQDTPVPPSPQ
jgi:hypothetical protein